MLNVATTDLQAYPILTLTTVSNRIKILRLSVLDPHSDFLSLSFSF